MYSSLKFFVPIVTVGVAVCEARAVLPMSSATPSAIANAALAARRVCFRSIPDSLRWRTLTLGTLDRGDRSTRGRPADRGEQTADRECERGDPERGGDDAGEPVARLVEDDLAEAAAACDRGDDRRRDHEDRRDPDPADHERQRERELDAPEDPAAAHAHAPRSLDDVAVDAVDGEVRVGQDRRDREHDERGGVVPEAEPEDREAEGDEDGARERATHVRDADRDEGAAVEMAEQEAERQRNRESDAERRARELDVLERLHEQQVRVVAHEPKCVDERVHRCRLVHGVARRSVTTSAASHASASATVSPKEATISVLKTVGIASAIGRPSPLLRTTKPAIVPIEIVDTTAMRRPAKIAGSASGISTRRSVCRRVSPMPRLASFTSSGTSFRPMSVLRKRISSVYETSAISIVVQVRPVTGTRSWKSAALGIV